jgi:3-hydroxybutyryl-CoA dehydrogenase
MSSSSLNLSGCRVLVIGAGVMGVGIAQVAAQSGHDVALFDLRDGAAANAKAQLDKTLSGLVAKGKMTAEAAAAVLGRIQPLGDLAEAQGCALAVEAIVENLDAKRSLFQQLESVLGDEAVLATNTSSISVTAIANGMKRPQRLVGMHFFNPVPLMKLVEVVSGLQTACDVAQAIFDLSQAWGKVPVHAKSTPGFIVNRIARPYYAETLALLQQGAGTPTDLDACLRGAGFRMGPCELMDLIGHDTNFSVTRSVYEANFFDKRFVPSLVQKELVDGGLLGRKSGQGFYDYREGAARASRPAFEAVAAPAWQRIAVLGEGPLAERLAAGLTGLGLSFDREAAPVAGPAVGLALDGLRLMFTDGRTATEVAAVTGHADLAVIDWPVLRGEAARGQPLAFAVARQAGPGVAEQVAQALRALGHDPVALSDAPGLVVARTLSMLINEAADAVQHGVCSEAGADAAMKLGVNYPAGPFEWLSQWGVAAVCGVLDALDAHDRGERYRVSPWLQQRRWAA